MSAMIARLGCVQWNHQYYNHATGLIAIDRFQSHRGGGKIILFGFLELNLSAIVTENNENYPKLMLIFLMESLRYNEDP